MTKSAYVTKKKASDFIEKCGTMLVIFTALILILFMPEVMRESAYKGILLCAKNIIPTLFPFMIFSDFMLANINDANGGLLSRSYEKMFGIASSSLIAFVCGILCGFPIGAICTKELYDAGVIDKRDAENLIGLSTLPSLAFVICAVGEGMLGSSLTGALLWLSCILSTLIVGVIFRSKEQKIKTTRKIQRQKFNLSASIKKSGYTAIVISSFIIFFSIACGVVGALIKNDIIVTVISSFLELSNACSSIATSAAFPCFSKLILIAFSLGFSGISVFMQVCGVVSESGLSLKTYMKQKLLQGVFCGIITALLIPIIL